MKLTCYISGLNIQHAPQFGKLWKEYKTSHPIFRLPSERLWNLAASSAGSDLQWRKLPDEEKKLLLLALLNNSGLVEFHAPARVSISMVEAYFPRVYYFCAWKNALRRPGKFPKYAVRADNASLESLGAWLNECEEIRLSEFLVLSARDKILKQAEIDEKINLLQKQSKLSKGAKTRYLNKLVNWILSELSLAEADEMTVAQSMNPQKKKEKKMADFIRDLFLTQDDDIHDINQEDLDFMVDYLAIRLPVGSISAMAVQERLREIKQKKSSELNSFELFAETDAEIDSLQTMLSVDKLVGVDAENAGLVCLPEKAAPLRVDFKTDFAYKHALARFLADRSTFSAKASKH